jgi:gas vesicle protein
MRRMMMLLAGAMCGALVGSVTALLLAPVSGMEVRQRIRGRVADIRADVIEAYETRRAQLEAELEALRKPRPSAEA